MSAFDTAYAFGRIAGLVAMSHRVAGFLDEQDGNTPEVENPLTDTLCHSDGRCATLAIRNQQKSESCLNTLCSQIRVRLTGDVVNEGDVAISQATLRLELFDGNGETVRTIRESVGALNPGESVQINKTVEGATLELQAIRNGGARLKIESWS